MSATPSLQRLRIGLVALLVVVLLAVLGYRLAGWDLLDAVYMVVITLSSVGFSEQSQLPDGLKLFTILVILFGGTTALYLVGGFVQMMAEGEITRALGLRRVTREIQRLSNHVIVCGFGRAGEVLAEELQRRGLPFVVIDSNPERVAEAMSRNYLAMNDDATEEVTLRQCGVERARALVVTLPGDADNVFITLTARNLNRQLQIIARAEHRSTEKKLIQAGADRVVLPSTAAALRMAALVSRPSTVELVELVSGRQIAEVQIDELSVPADSPLVGLSVRDSEARSRHGVLIVGLRRKEGELMLNPDPAGKFAAGDMVIVIGQAADIERFREEYALR